MVLVVLAVFWIPGCPAHNTGSCVPMHIAVAEVPSAPHWVPKGSDLTL